MVLDIYTCQYETQYLQLPTLMSYITYFGEILVIEHFVIQQTVYSLSPCFVYLVLLHIPLCTLTYTYIYIYI
jgi:hypothetical protein